jgi:hypothetical protein
LPEDIEGVLPVLVVNRTGRRMGLFDYFVGFLASRNAGFQTLIVSC